ncbi:uncharacterized protein LOC117907138 isoform X5 [Vitis riparia]|uniref:uncharacterized protein LOC117907138 isoform X5 n=1 Tax=Vitis riparia TaxID=96939 RepID=UPI00155B0B33|nr:uncharacterized protein LOC117907138 isoform X5 [Vitis riparia]
MELKLCHTPILTFSSQRLCLDSWISKQRSFKKHFRMLTEKWRFQIQEISKGQHSTKHNSVHMVKDGRGETLSSISKQYGVSIYSVAAANKNIEDIDLVFCGQHLNIPSSAVGETQKFQTEKSKLSSFDTLKRHQHSLEVLGGRLNQKLCTVAPSFHSLSHAKTTGYFLVLVPLIAFCIRCIIGAFQNRVVGDLRHQAVNESEVDYHGSKSVRWKSALDDIREPDTLDTGLQPDSILGILQVSASDFQSMRWRLNLCD